MRATLVAIVSSLVGLVTIAPAEVAAQSADTAPSQSSGASGSGSQSLQQAAANPIGNLTSVPFQFNTETDAGAYGRTEEVLQIKPVVPFALGNGATLVSRTIIPLIYQPKLSPQQEGAFGLGDVEPQFYFVPKSSHGIDVGVGPVFSVPTASHAALGQGGFGVGPDAVVVFLGPHTVTGALVNAVLPTTSDSKRSVVDELTINPFFTYNFKGGFSLGSSPIVTENWDADAYQRWTVPAGFVASQLTKFGKQAVQFQLGGYVNAVRPLGAPLLDLQFQLSLLYPKGKK